MDHSEALELLEIAAVEPDGLERLMAGDTPEAAAVAGHLAGCPTCATELEGIRRTAELAREAIRELPDPALRERTLSHVRSLGRQRGAGDGVSPAAGQGAVSEPVSARTPWRRPAGRLTGWAAAAASVLIVVSAAAGYLVGTGRVDDTLQARDRQIAILTEAATTTARIEAQPDAQQIALLATADAPGGAGSIVFSASEGELVATATNLPAPSDGQEYGCWVEIAGQRLRLGRMYWAGDIWTWAGPVSGLDAVPPGATFGVSLGPAGGGQDSTPMLTGTL